MLEKYYKYKLNYEYYLILIKYGNFYELIGEDAIILNKIMNYKLKKISNTLKVGFPINSLNKVINCLNKEKINYIVIDQDITIKKEFENNSYFNYNIDEKKVFYNYLRIEKIYKYLIDNIYDVSLKLEKIEEVIMK